MCNVYLCSFFFLQEKYFPVLCSTSSASINSLIRDRRAYNRDATPGTSKIVMSTGKLVFFREYKITNLLLCVILVSLKSED